jgi:hypothetical protein
MPLVEQYPNWVDLKPINTNTALVDYFYANSSAWQQRPSQSFFAECAWYKFPYCSHAPWYQTLNIKEVIGEVQVNLYKLTQPIFEHVIQQIGDEFIFWGAELNSIPPGVTVTPHQDRHFYSDYTTRVHAVLQTNADVEFIFETGSKKFNTNECFIFNNKLSHGIVNRGNTNRLHLVMDFVPHHIFNYVERSIHPFGGHEGTKHILSYLNKDSALYQQYINVIGKYSIYPKHVL